MSFNHVFKVSIRKKKRERKNALFSDQSCGQLTEYESLGTFYSSQPWRIPHGYCSEGNPTAPHCLSCLSAVQPKGIWSHRALSLLSWNSSLCNHSETSLTFKSMNRKRWGVKLSLSWDMTYSSLLATDTVGSPCSILQDCLSAAHLTTVTFLIQSRWGPNEYPRRSWRAWGSPKWHCEIWGSAPLPRIIQPQQPRRQFNSGEAWVNCFK